MKNFLKNIIFFPLSTLDYLAMFYSKTMRFIYPNIESQWHQFIISKNKKLHCNIEHMDSNKKHHKLKISTPNLITTTRAKTFSSKEPDTLIWIDGFNENSIFFDIGANIGLYSLYTASHKRNIKVSSQITY